MKNDKYIYESNNGNKKMIIRLTKTEFELSDGTIHPILFNMEDLPSIEEFQKIYDNWAELFGKQNITEDEELTGDE